MKNASPLRYPGGKWRLEKFFERIIVLNFKKAPIYIEPYAGGAGLALSLLLSNTVSEVVLNDLDPAIYSFWRSVLNCPEKLIQMISKANVTAAEWKRQKEIYAKGPASGLLKLGFATFFLNRTNHSGILNGGMIGGKKQSGTWKLDARFNREELVSRIKVIAMHRDRIALSKMDAKALICQQKAAQNKLIYLDPPYYRPAHLYLNSYSPKDHSELRDSLAKLSCKWIASYDDVSQIRKLYGCYRSRHLELLHTARSARQGKEVMFFSPTLKIPSRVN